MDPDHMRGSDRLPVARPSLAHRSGGLRDGDHVYRAVLSLAALQTVVLVVAIGLVLAWQSRSSVVAFGWGFLTGSVWDEVAGRYGVLPFLFGTLFSSFTALALAVPVSIGSAIHLLHLRPRWLRTPLTFLIELLAAIPSVVYGLWGTFVLVPFLRDRVMAPVLSAPDAGRPSTLQWIGLVWNGAGYGPSVLAAGLLLAIMITPTITAVARDVVRAVPGGQADAALGLGATHWETLHRVVLPTARPGIIGAVMLGFGRAFGETMAVTMVIGNQVPSTRNGISVALFDPGITLASALANKFTEATPGIPTAALIEIGLVLFVVGMLVNATARLLVYVSTRRLR
jgi:phosphate transport system permease protein